MSLFQELVNCVGGTWVTIGATVKGEKPPPDAEAAVQKYTEGNFDTKQN